MRKRRADLRSHIDYLVLARARLGRHGPRHARRHRTPMGARPRARSGRQKDGPRSARAVARATSDSGNAHSLSYDPMPRAGPHRKARTYCACAPTQNKTRRRRPHCPLPPPVAARGATTFRAASRRTVLQHVVSSPKRAGGRRGWMGRAGRDGSLRPRPCRRSPPPPPPRPPPRRPPARRRPRARARAPRRRRRRGRSRPCARRGSRSPARPRA